MKLEMLRLLEQDAIAIKAKKGNVDHTITLYGLSWPLRWPLLY